MKFCCDRTLFSANDFEGTQLLRSAPTRIRNPLRVSSVLSALVVAASLLVIVVAVASTIIIHTRMALHYGIRPSENSTAVATLNARIGNAEKPQAGKPVAISPDRARNFNAFTFEGERRQPGTSGKISITSGPESTVFFEMKRLIGQKDWQQLKAACEIEIVATPDWLTPYLFSGIARSNLGDLDGARERLEYVVANRGVDADYSQVPLILTEIEEKSAIGQSKN